MERYVSDSCCVIMWWVLNVFLVSHPLGTPRNRVGGDARPRARQAALGLARGAGQGRVMRVVRGVAFGEKEEPILLVVVQGGMTIPIQHDGIQVGKHNQSSEKLNFPPFLLNRRRHGWRVDVMNSLLGAMSTTSKAPTKDTTRRTCLSFAKCILSVSA